MNDFRFSRIYRGPLKAAVLDWAGTTLDYGCMAPAAVFAEVFRERGLELTNEEIREPMGTAKKVHLQRLLEMPTVTARWQTVHGRSPNGRDLDLLFEHFERRQIACLADYADLIPGAAQAVTEMSGRGMKIGSTTGYDAAMMEVLLPEARRRGYEPDAMICVSDVPSGRPGPWMMLENLKRLEIYPLQAVVKIDDTAPGIEEGLNGGAWTIGVAKTGSEVGLNAADLAALPAAEAARRIARAADRLAHAGAHFVIDSLADVGPCLDEINRRLSAGEKP